MRRECPIRSCHQFQRKPLLSDPGMHHDTCVKHVPWCLSGSLNRVGWENVPGIPGVHAPPAILRIWQEAHGGKWSHCLSDCLSMKNLPKIIDFSSYLQINTKDNKSIENWRYLLIFTKMPFITVTSKLKWIECGFLRIGHTKDQPCRVR